MLKIVNKWEFNILFVLKSERKRVSFISKKLGLNKATVGRSSNRLPWVVVFSARFASYFITNVFNSWKIWSILLSTCYFFRLFSQLFFQFVWVDKSYHGSNHASNSGSFKLKFFDQKNKTYSDYFAFTSKWQNLRIWITVFVTLFIDRLCKTFLIELITPFHYTLLVLIWDSLQI